MGRPAEVDEQAILAAGQQLAGSGRPVTGTGLRRIIGHGSPAYLMGVWLRLRPAPVANTPLPPELAARCAQQADQVAGLLTDLARHAWMAAQAAAAETAATAEARASQAVEATQMELADARQVIETLDEQIEAARAEILDLRAKLDAARAEVTRQTVLCQAAERRAAETAARDAQASLTLQGQVE